MKLYDKLILIALVLACSCTRESAPAFRTGSGIALDLLPTVTGSADTRAPIVSGGLPSYGLWICDHHDGRYTDGSNPYAEYAQDYRNIRAGGGMYYYSVYSETGFSTLLLLPPDENRDGITDKKADIFAYAPYVAGLTSPEAVPFSIAGGVDVMYPEENGTDNLDIDPADLDGNPRYSYSAAGGRRLEVPLTFHHALSLLEFDFRLQNTSFNRPEGDGDPGRSPVGYQLNSVTVTRDQDASHPLYISGTMNAMTGGTLSGLTAAESLTVTGLGPHNDNGRNVTVGPGHTYDNPARAYLLQVPSQAGDVYADGDYTFSFHFSGMSFPITFTLLKEHLKHSDNTYGFKPGYRYVFHFVIDNYVHFEGLTIGEWEAVADPYQYEI